ncbi:MAG: hypothetical protein GWP05_01800 [Anaerolineaceae bacterium]|nr:hypothetical protein [Anaerolineaceae bacterium]
MQKQNDRRRHVRTILSCPAKVFDSRNRLLVRGKTVDISAGGVKVLGPMGKEPQVGDEVKVEIDLFMPDSTKRRKVERPATIRRVETMGKWASVALEFTSLVDLEQDGD